MDVRDDYRKTETYKRATKAEKRLYDEWKEDQQMTDAQMALNMRLLDVRNTPKEEKKKGNRTAETLVIFSMVFFMIVAGSMRGTVLLVACGILFINTGIYLSGVTNPYSVAAKKIRKELKAYPETVSFAKWVEAREGQKPEQEED